MARVTTRAPYNVRCSYSAKHLVALLMRMFRVQVSLSFSCSF